MAKQMTPKDIIGLAGGALPVAVRMETSVQNVRNQASKDRLPAAWYFALCQMAGTDLPFKLFSFKGLEAQGQ